MANHDLPLGMTTRPYGWPEMDGAFWGFANFTLGKPEFLDQYKSDTGKDLLNIVPKSPIDKAINEATGFGKKELAEFLDWLVLNHWGEA